MFPPGSSRLTVTRLTTASLRLAVTLLTAIPLPHREDGGPPSRPAAGGAMIWAPVIGLLLGGIAAGVLYVFQRFWHAGPLLGATLAIVVLAALSGCLHLDGLADFADGLGSRKRPARHWPSCAGPTSGRSGSPPWC